MFRSTAIVLVAAACASRSGSDWQRYALGEVSVEVPADYAAGIDRDGNRLELAKVGEGAVMLERSTERFATPTECQASIRSVEGGASCRVMDSDAICNDVQGVHFVYFCVDHVEWKLVTGVLDPTTKRIVASLRVSR